MAKSKDIIQQLKDNEKPFGLMSAEMQEKAKEIGPVGNFLFLTPNKVKGKAEWALLAIEQEKLYWDGTYRLRPDYAEEPEIEDKEGYLVLPAILSKLEEIRCGLIDVESAIEKGQQ